MVKFPGAVYKSNRLTPVEGGRTIQKTCIFWISNDCITTMEKVWFITGCSTGFGRALAKQVLQAGYKAGVSARRVEDVADIVNEYPQTAIAIPLDVTRNEQIAAAVKQLHDVFGRIDVLVNNAGIGYFGAIEESEAPEVRRMFEINFFGLANVTTAVLPVMRVQRSGHILNIASIAGLVGYPAVGYYNATKFAVDGFSESLARETAHLGIKVTVIAPGGFRTDWAGRSANESPIVIDDYAPSAGANKISIRNSSGNQPGDPVRAAQAMIAVVESAAPPMRLLLGAGALRSARKKLELLQKDYDAWEATTLGADAPAEGV